MMGIRGISDDAADVSNHENLPAAASRRRMQAINRSQPALAQKTKRRKARTFRRFLSLLLR
jgi:hypothetical protein